MFSPDQYRGIHLTCILSKIVERVIAQPLVPFLEQHGFGTSQWAFRKKSSARDLVTICAARWVLAISKGLKVGLYLSDISGAFDKVNRCLLIGKLAELGLPSSFLDFLNSYLLQREGYVSVENASSSAMVLCDMVFQGTVLGPPLWNAFFGDVATQVPTGSQIMNIFADDLNAEIQRSSSKNEESILQELREIQTRIHHWGMQNQVTFDAGKEFFQIIHPTHPYGNDFKLLGSLIDCRLTMQPCVEGILAKARPKIRALLRLKHLYDTPTLIAQNKSHVWGISEYSNGILILASESQRRRLDLSLIHI